MKMDVSLWWLLVPELFLLGLVVFLVWRRWFRTFRKGVYAGSFDLMHEGHVSVMCKAAQRCRQLVILIAVNPLKKGMFTVEERRAVIRRFIQREGLTNVEIDVYEGLVLDYSTLHGCSDIVRGFRDAKDLLEETTQIVLNELIVPGIGTILFRQTDPLLRHASSSMIKFAAGLDVLIPGLAPAFVLAPMIRRVRSLMIVGVTGTISCGKSHVMKFLITELKKTHGDYFHTVDFDVLLTQGVYAGTTPGCQNLRNAFAKRFGRHVLTPDGTNVDRRVLKDLVFGSPMADRNRAWVVKLTTPFVMALYRDFLRGKKGVVFVQMAQLIEQGLASLVCNQVLIIDSPDRDALAAQRGISAEVLKSIRDRQWDTERKSYVLNELIASEGGFLITHQNRLGTPETFAASIRDLATRVLDTLEPIWPELNLPHPVAAVVVTPPRVMKRVMRPYFRIKSGPRAVRKVAMVRASSPQAS